MDADNLENSMKELASEASYLMTVPALRGHMGDIDYYVVTLPFSVVTRYVTVTDRNLPVRERENRKPTPSRYAEIANYIRRNPEDYRFSSLTCTYGKDGTHEPIKFKTFGNPFVGMLTLDQRDPLIIVDGQHRFKAIQKALDEEPSLGDDVISVVLFPYLSMKAAQQLFSDLNRTARKTTKSLDILFDYRDVANRVAQKLVDKVSVFKERVNLEDAGIAAYSTQVFTLAGIYQATKPMIDAVYEAGLIAEELTHKDSDSETNDIVDQYADFLAEVWEFIATHFPEWGKVATGELEIKEVRTKYLHWNSGVLSATGEFVAAAVREKCQDWHKPVAAALSHPENRGWRRDESHWQGIITAGTQVLPRSAVRPQLKAYLKNLADLPLTDGDQRNLKEIEKRKKLLEEAAKMV